MKLRAVELFHDCLTYYDLQTEYRYSYRELCVTLSYITVTLGGGVNMSNRLIGRNESWLTDL